MFLGTSVSVCYSFFFSLSAVCNYNHNLLLRFNKIHHVFSGASFNTGVAHLRSFCDSQKRYILNLHWLVASFTIVLITFFVSVMLWRSLFFLSLKEAVEDRRKREKNKKNTIWRLFAVHMLFDPKEREICSMQQFE